MLEFVDLVVIVLPILFSHAMSIRSFNGYKYGLTWKGTW
jgi:hypothetical protein